MVNVGPQHVTDVLLALRVGGGSKAEPLCRVAGATFDGAKRLTFPDPARRAVAVKAGGIPTKVGYGFITT